MADLKWGLAPGCSVPGLNLIQRVGCLSPFPDSRLSKAHHFKIALIPAAAYVADRLQIAGNDGALHADLLGDLLLGEFSEVQLRASAVAVRPPPCQPIVFGSWSYSRVGGGANPPRVFSVLNTEH